MSLKRRLYWSVLVVVGAAALALKAWGLVLWTQDAGSWLPRFRGFHPGVMVFGPLVMGAALVVLIGMALVLWYRQTRQPSDPLGDLALEYAEGRVDRDGYFERKAVLEEGL